MLEALFLPALLVLGVLFLGADLFSPATKVVRTAEGYEEVAV